MKETIGLSIVALWLLGIVGWVMNLVAIIHTMNLPITGLFIARLVGVFAFPLGGILGYF